MATESVPSAGLLCRPLRSRGANRGNYKSPYSIANAKLVLARFRRFVAEAGELGAAKDLCVEVALAYRAHLRNEGYAISSVRTHVQVLRAWSACLAQEGVFKIDPLKKRGLLPKLPKRVPRILADDDLNRVLALLKRPDPSNARNLAIFTLFYDTGIRVSELAGIKLADLDLRNRRVKVLGKGDKERWVGFGKKTAAYVEAYKNYHRRRVADDDGVSQGYLFLCHTGHGKDGRDTAGEPLTASGIKQVMRRIAGKLGIKLHCHLLRHTWATEFARNNAGSVADLKGLLGHESETMALYYAHSVNADAVEKQKTSSPLDRRQMPVHK